MKGLIAAGLLGLGFMISAQSSVDAFSNSYVQESTGIRRSYKHFTKYRRRFIFGEPTIREGGFIIPQVNTLNQKRTIKKPWIRKNLLSRQF